MKNAVWLVALLIVQHEMSGPDRAVLVFVVDAARAITLLIVFALSTV
jgi:hypothetical protein